MIYLGCTPETVENMERFSVSKIKTFRRCQKQYDYKYVQKLKRKTVKRPLLLGGLIHKCIEALENKEQWEAVINDYEKTEWSKFTEEEKEEVGDIPQEAFDIMVRYEKYWEKDKSETLVCEQEYYMLIKSKPNFLNYGFVDKIYKKNNKFWIMEHKTCKTFPSEDIRMNDTQTTMYMYFLYNYLKSKGLEQHIGGVTFNYIRTKTPGVPKMTKTGTLSKAKIDTTKEIYRVEVEKQGLDLDDYKEFISKLPGEYAFFKRIDYIFNKTAVLNSVQEFVNSCYQTILCKNLVSRCSDFTCKMSCDYGDICQDEFQLGNVNYKNYRYDKEVD